MNSDTFLELLKSAFFEGFQAGRDGGWQDGGSRAWSYSDTLLEWHAATPLKSEKES